VPFRPDKNEIRGYASDMRHSRNLDAHYAQSCSHTGRAYHIQLLTLMVRIIYRGNLSVWIGLAAGVIYAVVARLIIASARLGEYFVIMSIGFVFLVPLALGVLTVYFGFKEKPRKWYYWIFMPWISCLILLSAALLIGWEGSICILMALPIFLLMSSLGGLFTGLVLNQKALERRAYSLVVLFAALPFVSSSIEHRFRPPDSLRSVETQITINASPQTVWQNIERVREIKPPEQRFSVFHLMGFPRPVEATLSYEGVGGVRHATFEGGVLFVETINKWEPEKELAFSIKADTKSIPPTTLDEHVTIGGPYFDMLEGDYRIEQTGEHQVILHLGSKHRLSTRFNFYAGLWTDLIMRDIQNNILGIIKNRCEVSP
jgi:hypothetical protein